MFFEKDCSLTYMDEYVQCTFVHVLRGHYKETKFWFFYIIQLITGQDPCWKVSEMMLAISFNEILLIVCKIFLKALNYLIAVPPAVRVLSPAWAPRGLHRAMFMNSVSHGKIWIENAASPLKEPCFAKECMFGWYLSKNPPLPPPTPPPLSFQTAN